MLYPSLVLLQALDVVYFGPANAVNTDVGGAVERHFAALSHLAHFVLYGVARVAVRVCAAYSLIIAHGCVLTWPLNLLLCRAARQVWQPSIPDKLWIAVTLFCETTTHATSQ